MESERGLVVLAEFLDDFREILSKISRKILIEFSLFKE